MAKLYRFAAFVSYSSVDKTFARKLHRSLERYRIPSRLGQFDLVGGGRKNRIFPVFRDREELPAGNLSESISQALDASASLIVICSPNSARSKWVNREIKYFLESGRGDRVFAIIAPNADGITSTGGDSARSVFPDALMQGREDSPLAADARRDKDGFRRAVLKIIAGLISVNAGALVQRDQQRRTRQIIAQVITSGLALIAAASAFAWNDGQEWRSALYNHSSKLASSGRVIEALPFAIAAAGSIGDVKPTAPNGVGASLQQLGGIRQALNLGLTPNGYAWDMSENAGALLVTYVRDRTQEFNAPASYHPSWHSYARVYDLLHKGAATNLGDLGEESLAGGVALALSPDGRLVRAGNTFLVGQHDVGQFAYVVRLGRRAELLPLGVMPGGKPHDGISLYDFDKSSRYMLTTGGGQNETPVPVIAYDTTQNGRPFDLGQQINGKNCTNGSDNLYLLYRPHDGVALVDLSGDIKRLDLSPYVDGNPIKHADCDAIIFNTKEGGGVYVVPKRLMLRSKTKIADYQLLGDRAVTIKDENDHWTLFNFADPSHPIELGEPDNATNYAVDDTNSILIMMRANKSGILANVANGGPLVKLGTVTNGFVGHGFAIVELGDGHLYRFDHSPTGLVKSDLGQTRLPDFEEGAASADGTVIVLRKNATTVAFSTERKFPDRILEPADMIGISPDGAYVAARASEEVDEYQKTTVMELATGKARKIEYLGSFPYEFSKDGRYILPQKFNRGVLVDLKLGKSFNIGSALEGHYYAGGNVLYTTAEIADKHATLWDLRHDAQSTDLGRADFISTNATEDFLLVRTKEYNFTAYRLKDGVVRFDIGRAEDVKFSDDGRFVAVLRDNNKGELIQLDQKVVRYDLGVIENVKIRGTTLAVIRKNSLSTVYDLSRPLDLNAQATSARVAQSVCNQSGDVVVPFPTALRGGSPDQVAARKDEESRRLYGALRGRPWRACDWRGIASWENGRPEGLFQFARLVSVRFFRGNDYGCEDRRATGGADSTAAFEAARTSCELMRRTEVGQMVPAQDVVLAENKACAGGSDWGCANVAFDSLKVMGVEKDVRSRIAGLLATCNQGISFGCSSLAVFMFNGDGDIHAPKNWGLAKLFAKKACDLGAELGCSTVRLVESQDLPPIR